MQLGAVKMDFCYAEYFGQSPSTGYETLLYDCMVGDATLFHRADIVEAGWEIVAPVLNAWQAGGAPVSEYAAGSWDRLMPMRYSFAMVVPGTTRSRDGS